MKVWVIVAALIALPLYGDVKVDASKGRKSYFRTKPDKHRINNYGFKGNPNPKTFKKGTRKPPK